MTNSADTQMDLESQRHLALVGGNTQTTAGGLSGDPNISRLQTIGNAPIFSRMVKEGARSF